MSIINVLLFFLSHEYWNIIPHISQINNFFMFSIQYNSYIDTVLDILHQNQK